jgi:hypothetical protein
MKALRPYLVLMTALCGCVRGAPPVESIDPGTTVKLRFGEAVRINGRNDIVRFVGVDVDPACPQPNGCEGLGNGGVYLEYTEPSGNWRRFRMRTPVRQPQPVGNGLSIRGTSMYSDTVFAAYRYTLSYILPFPGSDTIPENRYEIMLRVALP